MIDLTFFKTILPYKQFKIDLFKKFFKKTHQNKNDTNNIYSTTLTLIIIIINIQIMKNINSKTDFKTL
jgi:hypothetical protein